MVLGIENASADSSWQVAIRPYDNHGKKELFTPFELPIPSNNTVIWVNYDSEIHKIASGVPAHSDYAGQFFDLGVIKPGESISRKIMYSGYSGYYYFCEIHPWFTGKVFFEDVKEMPNSTLKMEYAKEANHVEINGLTDSDFGKTQYELMIYDSKNHMVFHTLNHFRDDASFNEIIDVSSSLWYHDENYVAKISYGVPSESYQIPLKITQNKPSKEFIDKSNDICISDEKSIKFDNVNIPSWFKKTFCWFADDSVSSKEITDLIAYFQKHPLS